MDRLITDLRHALRRIAAAPLFSSAAILTLALGIGATTAVYSVVDALLLRPLPYRDPATLRQIWSVQGERVVRFLTPASVQEWRTHTDVFAGVEPFRNRSVALLGDGGPQLAFATEVGDGLMQALGLTAQLGRAIQPPDGSGGSAPVVVLSDGLWRSRFGGDRGVIGRTVRIDDGLYEIAGVMPPAFRFPHDRNQLWMPLTPSSASTRPVHAVARLRPGVTPEQARARVDAIAAALQEERPARDGWRIELRSLDSHRMNASDRYALYVLAAAVVLVLLIACANLSSLLLVQGAGREREIAVRAAVGASRARLAQQLVTEALVLACLGGAFGLMAALWAIDLLAAYTPRDFTFLSVGEIAVNPGVMVFAVGLTLLSGALSGAIPAIRISRATLHDALKSGARSATAPGRQERLRRGFVVAQLALSLMLLVGAGLLARTFVSLTRVDPGFDAHNLLAIDLSLPQWKYGTRPAQQAFFEDSAAGLRALPGVRAVTVAGGKPPIGGGVSFGLRFEIDGVGVVLDDPTVLLPTAEVAPDYFSVLGIPFLDGRTFSSDDRPGVGSRVVISQQMARGLWKGASPVGQRIRFDPQGAWHTVVGVVGDVYQLEYNSPGGLFAVYFPWSQSRATTAQDTLIVRTSGAPAPLVPAIRQQIWSVDPDQPILSLETMESLYGEFLDVPRFQAVLMGVFALMGVAIAAVGLYGVLSYAMSQRTREFGIRLALGASPRDVLLIVVRHGAGLFAAGLLLGSAGSVVLTGALRSLLIGIPPHDPLTYAVVVVVLAIVALCASWSPARRATRVDPVIALRCE